MKKFSGPLLLTAAFLLVYQVQPEKVTFPSKDSLIITADKYVVNDSLPWMVLCHQAGYSRGEYLETAGKFCKLGFNCLAIDQRSGKEVNGIRNETAFVAEMKNKGTTYLDAEQDIVSAVNYAFAESGKKVILLGSSYSASLALKIAATNEKVSAVMAFSPGEYFGTKLNLKKSIKHLNKPVFVTSSLEEAKDVTTLIKDVQSNEVMQFIPPTGGVHGSRALWKSNPNHNDYWIAVMLFMRKVK